MSIITPDLNPTSGLPAYQAEAYIQAKQGAPLVHAALLPNLPVIVQSPATSLPAKLTAGLPSMTAPGQGTPGVGMGCRIKEEMEASDWWCRLGEWVSENKVLAAGLVVGAYMVAHRGGRK